MSHPYTEFEDTEIWRTLERSFDELRSNRDFELQTDKSYVVGFLCKQLASLKRSNSIDLSKYPDIPEGSVEFPAAVNVAFAVCTEECGAKEFIVDGSTQRCQRCGSLMFRTDVSEYRLVLTEE